MRIAAFLATGLFSFSCDASADGLDHFQTLYDERSVKSRTLSIKLAPVNDSVRFSVTLRDRETGVERHHDMLGSRSV